MGYEESKHIFIRSIRVANTAQVLWLGCLSLCRQMEARLSDGICTDRQTDRLPALSRMLLSAQLPAAGSSCEHPTRPAQMLLLKQWARWLPCVVRPMWSWNWLGGFCLWCVLSSALLVFGCHRFLNFHRSGLLGHNYRFKNVQRLWVPGFAIDVVGSSWTAGHLSSLIFSLSYSLSYSLSHSLSYSLSLCLFSSSSLFFFLF